MPGRIATIGTGCVAALSVLALSLQVTGYGRLFSGFPVLYPMRHTVAVGLLCCALALSGLRGKPGVRARLGALLAGLIGATALTAQALRWMQWVDQYPAHPLTAFANFVHTAFPNAFCLMAMAAALIAIAELREGANRLVFSALAGCVVAAFAVCALLNEILKLIPASPAFEGEIAVDATAGFAIVGLILVRISLGRLANTREDAKFRQPVAVAVVGALIAFVTWRVLLHERTSTIEDHTQNTASSLAAAISNIGAKSSPEGATLLSGVAPHIIGSNFQFFFERQGRIEYQYPSPPRRYERTTVARLPAPRLGGQISVHPGSQYVRRGATWASHVVLAFGLCSSFLLAVCVYLLGIGRDRVAQVENEILERKKAEQELMRQTRLLEASNADLQAFAHVTSHDLQEPLRSMNGFAQLLSRRYKGQIDAEADEFLAYITQASTRMSMMINGLLDYSRVAYTDYQDEQVPLNEMVDWASSNLVLAVEESKATITVCPLPTIRGNRLQLGQVFQNLLGNAIKYRKDGIAPVIEIEYASRGGEHRISISDNGAGVDPRLHDRIFGLFKRGHGIEYPGSGVGLALCKRIVEKHGGRIWAESRPEGGSTFAFTLPDRETSRQERGSGDHSYRSASTGSR